MPIVNGRYEEKISTTFATVKQGKDEIRKKLEKARKVRISTLPPGLLKELMPALAGKDVKFILPEGEKPSAQLKELGPVAVTKARIYCDYKGKEASTGSVSFPDRFFSVIWLKGKILQIDALDYGKCVKCMRDTFDTAWRYSKK